MGLLSVRCSVLSQKYTNHFFPVIQVRCNYTWVLAHQDRTNSYLCKRWPHERTSAPILDVCISCREERKRLELVSTNQSVAVMVPDLHADWTVLPRHILNTLKEKTFVFSSTMMWVAQKQMPGIMFTLWFPRRFWAKHKLHFSQWKYFSLGPILQRQWQICYSQSSQE